MWTAKTLIRVVGNAMPRFMLDGYRLHLFDKLGTILQVCAVSAIFTVMFLQQNRRSLHECRQ